MSITYMTEDGYNKLKEEIAHLESVERPKISQQIGEARDKGDLSENAEYDAAKEAQGMLEAKISQLKTVMATARLIDEKAIGIETVKIMNRVTMKNLKTDKLMTYTLVSETEADFRQGKIAVNTPIGQGLMGKKVGDVVDITIPSGILSVEIIEIAI
ncbi:MAG: transcription elongation factor GreA [Bacteroidales bacterium]|jgi:transcription elongation factor GreA|nr:transcription elongation factor GreA [Bacteroidales bacterium]